MPNPPLPIEPPGPAGPPADAAAVPTPAPQADAPPPAPATGEFVRVDPSACLPPSAPAPDDSPAPPAAKPPFRSGFVALLGEPNAGKSTLMNALIDFKVAIVSPKPQTTRDPIRGIYTDEQCQIVLVDTPGVMEPRDRFNTCLRDSALEQLQECDAVCHLVEAPSPRALPPAAAEALARLRKPVFLVVNKADLLSPPLPAGSSAPPADWAAPFDLARYQGVFFVSAVQRSGLPDLLAALRGSLPPGELLYDAEATTDRDMRFLAGEIVREKVLENLMQEVPYAVAVRTEEFVERPGAKHLVRVAIFVESESQKAILIGQGGGMLRKIGSEARPPIEEMADHPVYLELWVKVLKNWRKDENALKEFGYKTAPRRPRKRKR